MTPSKAKAKPASVPSSLDALHTSMVKKYGSAKIVRRSEVVPYVTVPTGSFSLDEATVVGGWVRGRIHEIAGQEGSGKTTLVISSMVQAQKKFPHEAVGIVDMEQTFDWAWAEANGLDTSPQRFVYAYPDNSEDVSDQVKEMIETGLFSLVAVDSIGGMESQQALDKEAEEAVVGRNAQVITRMSKKLAVLSRRHQVAVLLVNQFRSVIGGMGGDTTAGPKALKYATTMRVDVRQVYDERLVAKLPGIHDPQVVAVMIAGRVVRNKVGPAGRTGKFLLVTQPTEQYGPIGIDVAEEALTMGIRAGVITVESGGYHSFPWTTGPKERIRGRDTALAYLREHPAQGVVVRDAAILALASQVVPEMEHFFDPETGEVLE